LQITELTLHDFRTYGGRHTIALKPKSATKPIILFGGLNGAGKTTLLDALQLVLYGKRARCAGRGDSSYKDYLRDSIHRNSNPADGCCIELAFTQASEGQLHEYRVSRSWRGTDRGVAERVDVLVDGAPDLALSEHWDERVDDFAPHRIAHLFFFDGEKIEALADEEQSSGIVRTALHSLLGLDLVDRLKDDLAILDRKIRKGMLTEPDRAVLENLEKEHEAIKGRVEEAHSDRATLQSRLDRAQQALSVADELYRQEGGELAEKRRALEGEQLEHQGRVDHIREQFSERLAADVLPFGQVSDLLERMSSQAALEGNTQQSKAMISALEARDEELVKFLESDHPGIPTEILTSYLSEDRNRRMGESASEEVLGLDGESARALDRLIQDALPAAVSEAENLSRDLDMALEAAVRVTRLLEKTPETESVEDLRATREQAKLTVAVLEAERASKTIELERLSSTKDALEQDFLKELSRDLDHRNGKEQELRFTDKISEARVTLDRFRQAILEENLTRVEASILDSFRGLVRKEGLVSSLRIDPESFTIVLRGPDGKTLRNKSLSAGERQLLAVATLWGLARVAGLPLPVVIDTPLGRLDSKHRSNMIDSYFPKASHQVLLLSTDEEIEQQRLAQLGPYVGRSYLLEHKEDEDRTVVQEGYFWN